jgi:GT2 family glycosyltransferase
MVSVITPSYGRFDSLMACVESVRASNPTPAGGIEVVIVTAGYHTAQLLSLRDTATTLIELDAPLSTSASRNTGVAASSGRYLMFLDDDNVVAPDSIALLSDALDSGGDAVVVGPAMYFGAEPTRLWCAGVSRSRVLMKTTFRNSLPTPMPARMSSDDFPNCFMVRRREFDVVNGFDAVNFPQQWEESDLARRLVRKSAGQVYVIPSARIWHFIDTKFAERLHLRNPTRAFLIARGRAVFTAIHGDRIQWIAYLLVAQWAFGALYLGAAVWYGPSDRLRLLTAYLRGMAVGLVAGWRARGTTLLESQLRPRPNS